MSPTIIDPYHNESYYETHSIVVCAAASERLLRASAQPPRNDCCVTERSTLIDCGEERLQRPPSPLLKPHYHCLETINHMASGMLHTSAPPPLNRQLRERAQHTMPSK